MIIGRSHRADLPAAPAPAQTLGAAGSRRRATSPPARRLAGVGFDLRQGEILGVAGLQGMGQQELFLACFGMAELAPAARSSSTAGRCRIGSPADAIRPNIGIGLVPEDRKTEGLFLKLSGTHNASTAGRSSASPAPA